MPNIVPQSSIDALAARLTTGALPGELVGFDKPEIAEAAKFLVPPA